MPVWNYFSFLFWMSSIMEENHTNVFSVNMRPLEQTICGHMWEHTLEKSHKNTTSVNLHSHGQRFGNTYDFFWILVNNISRNLCLALKLILSTKQIIYCTNGVCSCFTFDLALCLLMWMCIFKLINFLEYYLHCLQPKGFSPMCERMWHFKVLELLEE